MIGRITAVVAATAGGEREAGQAGPEVLADYKGWQPGWPELCACLDTLGGGLASGTLGVSREAKQSLILAKLLLN